MLCLMALAPRLEQAIEDRIKAVRHGAVVLLIKNGRVSALKIENTETYEADAA